MKEEILKLRNEGKTYNEIKEILGCSKSLISYYCGEGQKEKNYNRTKKRRKDLAIIHKVEHFQRDRSKHKLENRQLRDKCEDFQRERIFKSGRTGLGKRSLSFRWQDVIEKFGWETTCYLTGRKISIKDPKTYHFDHKTPYSKGGKSVLENLGIACKEANFAKSDMEIEEFLQLCKEILEHNGYQVSKGN